MNNDNHDRPVEPEHPMMLEGDVVNGDTRFMLACVFEDFLGSGTSLKQLQAMTRDPTYQSLYAGYVALGEAEIDRLLGEASRRVGVLRFKVWEAPSCPSCPSRSRSKESNHAEGL